MPHPHDAQLQAHLDGELATEEMQEIDRHLAACDSCSVAAYELARLSVELSETVLRLDEAEPTAWRTSSSMLPELWRAADGAARSQRSHQIHPAHPAVTQRAATAGTLSTWKWAAAALLMVTGVASAAVVGAPLLRGSRPTPAGAEDTPPAVVATSMRPAGAISMRAANGEMVVALSAASAGSRLFVRVTDQAEAVVSVRTDSMSADPARFRTSDARITVQLPRAVSVVEVELPGALRSGRVVVGDRVVATVSDGRVVPAAAAVEGISLAPPGSSR